MAASLNKVLLMGNLTRDPEVKYTPKGTAVGDLAIAINDSYKAQDGTIKETVTFSLKGLPTSARARTAVRRATSTTANQSSACRPPDELIADP